MSRTQPLGSPTSGQDEDALENALFLGAESKALQWPGDSEDVLQEPEIIESWHLVDVQRVATDVCEDAKTGVERLVGGQQPRLKPRTFTVNNTNQQWP